MDKARLGTRLLGAFVGAAVGVPAGIIMNIVLGEPTTVPLAIPGSAAGFLVGGLLAPALIDADRIKTTAMGIIAGLAGLPAVGVVIGTGLGYQELTRGNWGVLVEPIFTALFISVAFLNLLFVSLPAGLVWATISRVLLQRRRLHRVTAGDAD